MNATKYLIEKGTEIMKNLVFPQIFKKTPLNCASDKGSLEIVKYLLDNEIYINNIMSSLSLKYKMNVYTLNYNFFILTIKGLLCSKNHNIVFLLRME